MARLTNTGDRPTGITRTAPLLAREQSTQAYKSMLRGLQALNEHDDALFYFGLAQKPRHDVLHFYIITAGRVIGRCNIAAWLDEPPTNMEMCDEDWSGACKWWVVLTAPFERPLDKLRRRGHQGIRYVYKPLW